MNPIKNPSRMNSNIAKYERALVGLFRIYKAEIPKILNNARYLSRELAVSERANEELSRKIEEKILVPANILVQYETKRAYNSGKIRAGQFLLRFGIKDEGTLLNDQNVLKILTGRQLDSLKGITDEMSKQIKQELSDGILKGEGMDDLARRIVDKVDTIGIERARTLARTETMYSFNQGAKERYKAHGIDEVEWLAAEDERTCTVCGSNHGKLFKIGSVDCPAHPNCRCVLLPVIEEVE